MVKTDAGEILEANSFGCYRVTIRVRSQGEDRLRTGGLHVVRLRWGAEWCRLE